MGTIDLVLPVMHLNGTSRVELIQLRCDTLCALRAAAEQLGKMAPNARDYYPEPGRLKLAEQQHRGRADMVHRLIDEITREAEAISDLE